MTMSCLLIGQVTADYCVTEKNTLICGIRATGLNFSTHLWKISRCVPSINVSHLYQQYTYIQYVNTTNRQFHFNTEQKKILVFFI